MQQHSPVALINPCNFKYVDAQAAAAQQLAAATGADGSASPSPLSGSAHSFEHLSDHFALPSSGSDGEPVFASDGEPVSGSDANAVPSSPSLPDLEALPEHEAGDSLASSAMTGGDGGGGSTSEAGLEASFAEQLQMAAAGLDGGGGGLGGGAGSLAASFASSGVHQLAGGSQGASPLGSSYSDLAASAASGAGAAWEAHPVLQQALAHLEVCFFSSLAVFITLAASAWLFLHQQRCCAGASSLQSGALA